MSMIYEIAKRPRQISLAILGLMELSMSGAIIGQSILPFDESSMWHMTIPIPLTSTLWGIAGILALLGTFLPKIQLIGFVASTVMPTERALSNLWSWFMWVIPEGPNGYQWAFWEASWWGLFVLLIVWSSGLSTKLGGKL